MDKRAILIRFKYESFFALILFLVSLCILVIAVLPYYKQGKHESNLNYSVRVSTDNYRLNQSSTYLIGALKSGENKFYLLNNSNEKVNGKFVLSIKNESCNQILRVYSDNSEKIDEFYLISGMQYDIFREYTMGTYLGESIYYSVKNAQDACLVMENLKEFPISILSWKMVD